MEEAILDELKKYTLEDVQSMAEAVASEIAAGVITMEQLSDTLSQFMFRDTAGSYWSTTPGDQKWYRFSSDLWEAAESSPATLEGLASMAMWAPSISETSASAKTEFDAKRDASVHEFIRNMIKGIAESYERGEITTITAHALASQIFLMDQENHFWTTGLTTGQWYFFNSDQWHPSDEPPPVETLMDTNDPEKEEALDEKVIDFLVAMDGTPPEAIADPWKPPDNFPEPIIQCPSCSRLDVGTHNQCRFCQAELLAPDQAKQKTTKFCTHCGHEQPRRMKFCVQCGKKF
jgi:hypothetical protein